jgi:transposase InsO family protein
LPWKVSQPVELRVEFVTRHQRGERVSDLCREYGISRKTGHAILKRFKASGATGLADQSRAPLHIPHRTRAELVELIVAARRQRPSWGPKKLKDSLEEMHGVSLPSSSTIGDILKKHGLVAPRRCRVRAAPRPTKLRATSAPNQVWCADYKGQFRLGNGTYCYPLTITDHHSRFLFACEGMDRISDDAAREHFLCVFREHGLPTAIRSDNGVPFASQGLATLTRLSALWLRLGIELERIQPGHPEQNGRHERMHRTLKRDTMRPAAANQLAQQERFDAFVQEFNYERPHEALDMKRPAQLHTPAERRLPPTLPTPTYPLHDDVLSVDAKGRVHVKRTSLYVARALAHEEVGMKEEDDGRLLLTFMKLDLGHVERDGRTFTVLSA